MIGGLTRTFGRLATSGETAGIVAAGFITVIIFAVLIYRKSRK